METLSQMATSAAKLAFGDKSNTEPVSGVQGDVSKGQPYDAGNLDPIEQERVRENLSGGDYHDVDSSDAAYTTGSQTSGDAFTSSNHTSSVPGGFPGGQDVPKSLNTGNITTATNETSDTGFTQQPQHDMNAPDRKTTDQGISSGGITTSTIRTTETGLTSPGNDMGGPSNTSNQDFDDNNKDSAGRSTFNQNPDAPRTDSLNRTSPSKIRSTGDDADATNTKLSGAGPRDVATIARENDGDAGNSKSKTTSASSGGGKDTNTAAATHEDDKDKGTGEQYVKSSGLQADGGDFDATKPGAGREADRLMEQKGISTSTSGGSGHGSSSSGDNDHKSHGNGGKEKHGIVDKIKDKLHKH